MVQCNFRVRFAHTKITGDIQYRYLLHRWCYIPTVWNTEKCGVPHSSGWGVWGVGKSLCQLWCHAGTRLFRGIHCDGQLSHAPVPLASQFCPVANLLGRVPSAVVLRMPGSVPVLHYDPIAIGSSVESVRRHSVRYFPGRHVQRIDGGDSAVHLCDSPDSLSDPAYKTLFGFLFGIQVRSPRSGRFDRAKPGQISFGDTPVVSVNTLRSLRSLAY